MRRAAIEVAEKLADGLNRVNEHRRAGARRVARNIVASVREFLGDPDPRLRAAAADAAGALRDRKAVGPLTAMLEDENPSVR